MSKPLFVSSNDIRTCFSVAMSQMYRQEVPRYGELLKLVGEVNADVLTTQPELHAQMNETGELERLDVERHGAIRLGTALELATMRRLFAVMGMEPVGYYDLSVAGVPVHSTAFRPIDDAALAHNPFRVFTSLLRLELITDKALRVEVAGILSSRRIFTENALALIGRHERVGGLDEQEATEFVAEALQTFRWHPEATVDRKTYDRLCQAHRLIADVVCFKGPHINHLTPRTLDIDAAQAAMPAHGIAAKESIEGPPRRRCAILLRQTSFKALEENVLFRNTDAQHGGTHTARFGEIEQRGIALTREGRQRYDDLLTKVGDADIARQDPAIHVQRLTQAFEAFPDDYDTLRREELGFFRYTLTERGMASTDPARADQSLEDLITDGLVHAHPIVYEDFLPVSAAGIFQSNLGDFKHRHHAANPNRQAFEAALGTQVHDEIKLYEAAWTRSVDQLRAALRARVGQPLVPLSFKP